MKTVRAAVSGKFGRTLASIGAIAIVTAAIAVLQGHIPVLSLAVLYLLAIIPVAGARGNRLRSRTCNREHARVQLLLENRPQGGAAVSFTLPGLTRAGSPDGS